MKNWINISLTVWSKINDTKADFNASWWETWFNLTSLSLSLSACDRFCKCPRGKKIWTPSHGCSLIWMTLVISQTRPLRRITKDWGALFHSKYLRHLDESKYVSDTTTWRDHQDRGAPEYPHLPQRPGGGKVQRESPGNCNTCFLFASMSLWPLILLSGLLGLRFWVFWGFNHHQSPTDHSRWMPCVWQSYSSTLSSSFSIDQQNLIINMCSEWMSRFWDLLSFKH